MTQAYPLQWPDGWKRSKYRRTARFNTKLTQARDSLIREIKLLGGRLPILSTNVELRRDGLPYANRRHPDDPGVAVYFEYNKQQMCFACDQWTKIRDNVQAIRKTIEAFRGMERWGASDMMNRAFTAFTALPSLPSWREALNCHGVNDIKEVTRRYKVLRSACHPDKGAGNGHAFYRVNQAYDEAVKELGR